MKTLNPKKILIASSVHVWLDTRIYFKEAISLAENGFEVVLIARDGADLKEAVHRNITLVKLPEMRELSRVKACRQIYKLALDSDAMYYHFHDPELLPVAWLLKKRKKQTRVIFDMHENFPKALLSKDWIKPPIRKMVVGTVRVLEPRLLAACDGVIFAEESYKKDYPFLRRTVDIYNLPHDPGELAREQGADLVLTYVGGITKIRGAMEMLALVKVLQQRMANVKLQLIGPIAPALKLEMMAYVEEQRLERHVCFYDRLSYEEIWTELAKTTIGLCLLHPVPNYMESMPTKFYEYMAAALPILSSDIPLWTRFLNENEAGWTADPFDSQMMADDILEVYKAAPSSRLAKMGWRGRDAFLKKYNWQQEERKLVDFYEAMRVVAE
ncbi:glycosyltransferase family 4 protein [Listeria booriae]|uniref:Glycosyltransferase family 4 protein n=1 Tax=Listeria booriae TaxID=1552123 RepID=A0A7X1D6H1_9LIST|nr:glycosyltransferase [Listeria booriae]MBC2167469.1 glycosyltransferase family 4 protein [Listeria booriae]